MKLLYQYENDYINALTNAIDIAGDGLTLGEFLELGFNNATLVNPNGKKIEDLFMSCDGTYFRNDLTDKMLETRVVLVETEKDYDGYTDAILELENEEDWNNFKEIV